MADDDLAFKRNFAASVQKIYEYFFSKILTKLKQNNFSENLVFAGGCALNSSANRLLTLTQNYFKNTYITYAPGDNGGALGAAFEVLAKYNNKKVNLTNPYLGPKYQDEDIKRTFQDHPSNKNLYYEYIDGSNLYNETSKLISKGNVIGWFQDRMEFGPRALGNRSILADPRNPNMKDIINSKIKRRESFRPFAPSVLKDLEHEWFQSSSYSPYMSSLANVLEDKKLIIPAITHFDGTARLQSVDFKMNPRFHELLKSFYKLTNVPILLNTSFNENEPIVMTPKQALDCLLRTDMDALVINNFLIKKLN